MESLQKVFCAYYYLMPLKLSPSKGQVLRTHEHLSQLKEVVEWLFLGEEREGLVEDTLLFRLVTVLVTLRPIEVCHDFRKLLDDFVAAQPFSNSLRGESYNRNRSTTNVWRTDYATPDRYSITV